MHAKPWTAIVGAERRFATELTVRLAHHER